MACSLFACLPHRRRRRLHSASPPASIPPFTILDFQPATSTDLQLPSLTTIQPPDNDNSLLSNNMATQGPAGLIARGVLVEGNLDGNLALVDIDQPFNHLDGYEGYSLERIRDSENHCNLIYFFRTAIEASNALLNRTHIIIGRHQYQLASWDGDPNGNHSNNTGTSPSAIGQDRYSSEISPPYKRLKKERPPPKKELTCKICCGELEGPYSTPCRRCKAPWCYQCLIRHFETALKDIERMPAWCCAAVMHFEVAKGVLPTAVLEDYKLKYDERVNTVDPLYCPIPACSTFIPARTFNGDKVVACPICSTAICTECKRRVESEHVCVKEDTRYIIETFQYKLCPKCGTGVMKMYGCE